MAITLASVKGRALKSFDPELDVPNKCNVLQEKENKRIKRREMIEKELSKVKKDNF